MFLFLHFCSIFCDSFWQPSEYFLHIFQQYNKASLVARHCYQKSHTEGEGSPASLNWDNKNHHQTSHVHCWVDPYTDFMYNSFQMLLKDWLEQTQDDFSLSITC